MQLCQSLFNFFSLLFNTFYWSVFESSDSSANSIVSFISVILFFSSKISVGLFFFISMCLLIFKIIISNSNVWNESFIYFKSHFKGSVRTIPTSVSSHCLLLMFPSSLRLVLCRLSNFFLSDLDMVNGTLWGSEYFINLMENVDVLIFVAIDWVRLDRLLAMGCGSNVCSIIIALAALFRLLLCMYQYWT